MKALRRSLCLVLLSAVGSLGLADAASASGGTASSASSVTADGVGCTNVRELGTKKVGVDLGMSAFTVRQYIGYCSDKKGSAWMNFGSVYVWQQYHVRAGSYMTGVGIDASPDSHYLGYVNSDRRQRLMYSTPVRTVDRCTRALGKVFRITTGTGAVSPETYSSWVC